jgi:hypothetical protein
MAVYQVCSNKSPLFKIGIGPGVYLQVSDIRAIMALFLYHANHMLLGYQIYKTLVHHFFFIPTSRAYFSYSHLQFRMD